MHHSWIDSLSLRIPNCNMLLIVGIVWLMAVGPSAVHPNCAPYTKQAPPVFELNSAKMSAVELNDLYPRMFYRIPGTVAAFGRTPDRSTVRSTLRSSAKLRHTEPSRAFTGMQLITISHFSCKQKIKWLSVMICLSAAGKGIEPACWWWTQRKSLCSISLAIQSWHSVAIATVRMR